MKKEKNKLKKEVKVILCSLLILSFVLISFMGSMLNIMVVAVNDGRMPVDYYKMGYYYEDNEHFTYTNPEDVNKVFLTDRYRIGRTIYSIGDFLISLGFFLVIAGVIYFIIVLIRY